MTYREFRRRLTEIYDEREAKAVAQLVYEERFGLSMADICMGDDSRMTAEDCRAAEEILSRLLKNEPVQYILGYEYFCQSRYLVKPGVLIPRPETAALVQWMIDEAPLPPGGGCPGGEEQEVRGKRLENSNIKEDMQQQQSISLTSHPLPLTSSNTPLRGAGGLLLDCCCGSGCIALEMKRAFPGMQVSAYDISDTALEVTRENARRLGRDINIFKMDALRPVPAVRQYDIIVSNPPYVCEHEKADMRRNVLDYEPATALFVPDGDPLRFYSAIACYARQALKDGGRIYFEINPLFAGDIRAMLSRLGFRDICVNGSCGYKDRLMRAVWQQY